MTNKKRSQINFWVSILIWLQLAGQFAFTQDSSVIQVPPAPEIKMSVFMDQKSVPLNRNVLYTVRIMWQADRSRYEIEDFKNPVLHNLDIDTVSTLNRVSELDGIQYTVREYHYSLKPSSMGMGYVDNLIIGYKDLLTEQRSSLTGQRLEVKIIEPIPEPGDKSWIWQVLLGIIVISALGLGFFLYRNKKLAQRQALAAAQQNVPVEEKYLEQLRASVNLNKIDIDLQDSFFTLSKLMRRYLSDCYPSATLELTTEALLQTIDSDQSSVELVRDTREILQTCDLAKFSGTASKSDLDRVYTLMEAILMRNRDQKAADPGDPGHKKH